MNSYVMFAVFALAAVVSCEPPSGYNYNRPSFGGSAGGVSAGGNSFGGGLGGGNYEQVAIGPNTQEGLSVDPALLEQIKQIILNEESKAGAGSSAGQPASTYGAPQQSYGPPAQQSGRVVGIDFENTIPAIQVAQLRAQSQEAAGGYASSSNGYPSGPASGFGVAPSSNYGVPAPPARPSSQYGAPGRY